jgi:hypothetical protein
MFGWKIFVKKNPAYKRKMSKSQYISDIMLHFKY